MPVNQSRRLSVAPMTDWSEFAMAVRRKLVMELVDRTAAPVVPVQFAPAQPKYDCLIGEKIWNDMMRGWN